MKNNLKNIRMRQYMMNAKEFASYLGINYTQYNKYELGHSLPSLEMAFEISRKLELNIYKIWYKE